MGFAVFHAVLVLPVNVLVVIPSLLLWWSGRWRLSRPNEVTLWLGLALLALGLTLMTITIRQFAREGKGTLAPWDPTQRLVVNGVYRHVRNPMITGVLCNLAGEALLLRAPAIGAWFALFLLVNAVYLPCFEEPGLEKRFGEDYRRYRAAVPRWIPRLRPWQGETPQRGGGQRTSNVNQFRENPGVLWWICEHTLSGSYRRNFPRYLAKV
jgi:protein-S-isoprenylcysteine O-methyltransferase Ste14